MKPLPLVISHVGVFLFGALIFATLGPRTRVAPVAGEDGVESPHVTTHESAPRQAEEAIASERPLPAVTFAPDAGARTRDCPSPETRVARTFDALESYVSRLDVDETADANPEVAANAIAPYVDGWADALLSSDPDAVHEVGTQLSTLLCAPQRGRATTLTLVRIGTRIGRAAPELQRGIECVLNEGNTEDVALWAALDVWRIGEYQNPALIARLRERSTDERTIRRLASRAEQIAARTALRGDPQVSE
jgi:hypothetical protein